VTPLSVIFGGLYDSSPCCPTGRITAATAPEYLALLNVACVGGSWVVPSDRLAAYDWSTIEALARDSAALKRGRA